MNRVKLLYSIAHLCIIFSLFGCIHSTVHLQKGAVPESDRVTLLTDSKDVTIERIDGKKVSTMRQIWDAKWDAEVYLDPGEHEITAKFWNGPTFKQHITSFFLFKLDAKAGQIYQIKHKLGERSAKLWVEDKSSQRQGKVIASKNETVDDPNEIIDQSVYFAMLPPPGAGWIIPDRNTTSISFAKEGRGQDETYAVSVFLVEIPKLAAREEFLAYVKSGREKNTDSKRFNIVQDNYAYYDGREDYCIQYHSITQDNAAQKRSNNKEPMLFEMVGFFCRHPQNKNAGIYFDYSHRYYSGNQDDNLVDMAKKTFNSLKF
jgi:hypothetical protein